MENVGEAIHGHYGQYVSQKYGDASDENVQTCFLNDIDVGASDCLNYIMCLRTQKNVPFLWSIYSTTESISGLAKGYQSIVYCRNSLENLYEIERFIAFPFVTAEECNQYLSKPGTFSRENRAEKLEYMMNKSLFDHTPETIRRLCPYYDYVKISKKLLAHIAVYCIYKADVGAKHYLTILVPENEDNYQKYCCSVITQILGVIPSYLRRGLVFATNTVSHKKEKFGIVFQREQGIMPENAVRLNSGDEYPFLTNVNLPKELCCLIEEIAEHPELIDSCYEDLEKPLYSQEALTRYSYVDYDVWYCYSNSEITCSLLKEWNQILTPENSNRLWLKEAVKKLVEEKVNVWQFECLLLTEKESLDFPEDIYKLLDSFRQIIEIVYGANGCFSHDLVKAFEKQVVDEKSGDSLWHCWNQLADYYNIFLGRIDEIAQKKIQEDINNIEQKCAMQLLNTCLKKLRQDLTAEAMEEIVQSIDQHFPKRKRELLGKLFEKLAGMLEKKFSISRIEIDRLYQIHEYNQLETSFESVYEAEVIKDDYKRLAINPTIALVEEYIHYKNKSVSEEGCTGEKDVVYQIKEYLEKQKYAGSLKDAENLVLYLRELYDYVRKFSVIEPENEKTLKDCCKNAVSMQLNGIMQKEPLTLESAESLFKIAEKLPDQGKQLKAEKEIQQYIIKNGNGLNYGQAEKMKRIVEKYSVPTIEFEAWYKGKQILKEEKTVKEITEQEYDTYTDYIEMLSQNYSLLIKYPKKLAYLRNNMQKTLKPFAFAEFLELKNLMDGYSGLYLEEFEWLSESKKIHIVLEDTNIMNVINQISEYGKLAESADIAEEIVFKAGESLVTCTLETAKNIVYPYLVDAVSNPDKKISKDAQKVFMSITQYCILSKREKREISKTFKKSKDGIIVAVLCAMFFLLGGAVVMILSLLNAEPKGHQTLPVEQLTEYMKEDTLDSTEEETVENQISEEQHITVEERTSDVREEPELLYDFFIKESRGSEEEELYNKK